MSQIKKLAGQTALYGISSILGRMAYFLLTPFHTRWFDESQYGVVTRIYAFAGVLNVLYTLGMETTYFRFANDPQRNENDVFSTTSTLLLGSSTLFSGLIYFYAPMLSQLLFMGQGVFYIKWVAITLAIDGLLVVPFARLRFQNRPLYFAAIRFSGILLNIGLNFFFFVYCQHFYQTSNAVPEWVQITYNPAQKEGYVFLANLIANGLTLALLLPQFKGYRFVISKRLLSKMLGYAFPLLIMGISGMMMEMFGRQAFPDLLPTGFYHDLTPTQALGVFGACAKLGVFMTLSVQAFRYAADPFFFSKAQDKTSKPLFAQVLTWFVIFCAFMLVVISVSRIWLAQIFIDQRYHQGLHIVPIMLGANLLLGIYYNLSIWFKLTDKTYFGLILGVSGMVINIIANLVLVPIAGITGAALANLITYLFLVIVSYYLGRKHYPVPYPVGRILIYLLAAGILASFQVWVATGNLIADVVLGAGLSILYLVVIWFTEPNLPGRFLHYFKKK